MPAAPLPPALLAFLAKPHSAVVGTVRDDGSPVTTACWYGLEDDGRILLTMDRDSHRLRHLRGEPRVALTVLGNDWYNQLSLLGRAVEIRDDPELARHRRSLSPLSRRALRGPLLQRDERALRGRALAHVGRSSRRGSLTYYRDDLALVHHLGFGFHADATAPGILALLEPVRGGLVLELGCGSGLLTRYLVEARPPRRRHGRLARDAGARRGDSARRGGAAARSPRRSLPECDAVVSVGHVLSYLPDEAAVDRALAAAADALRPGGVLALDLCDLRYGELRRDEPNSSRIADDWAIVTRFSLPRPNLFVREIAAFLRNEDGTWRRDDERHENVLVDTALAPALLAEHGVQARVAESFGDEELPDGLVAIVGHKVDG